MNHIRKRLLRELTQNQNQYISGQALSESLNVSRAAIWKHIEELRKDGYIIEAVRKQGYKIKSVPDNMQPSSIVPYLETRWMGHHLHMFDRLSSTQHEAHRLAREGAGSGTVVVAEHQTKGKGRMGRKWDSPKGAGLWMSMVLRPEIPVSVAPQLTLLTAVAVLRAIKQLTGILPGIKWPNDLLIRSKKVAGILTEMDAEMDCLHYVVIGIGINVNQSLEQLPDEIAHIATSLSIEKGKPINRRALMMSIFAHFENLYELYVQHGFSPVKSAWEAHAITLGEVIHAKTVRGYVEGVAREITDDGVLLVEDGSGIVHHIYSADIQTAGQ